MRQLCIAAEDRDTTREMGTYMMMMMTAGVPGHVFT